MKTQKLGLFAIASLMMVAFVQCNSSNDDLDKTKGKVLIEMTDAPADNAEVKGTFITVTEVKVDGKAVEGFSKQTIEISAYHSGEVMMLVEEQLEAGTYQEVSIVLDAAKDDRGNSPGCYVLTDDGNKHALSVESGGKFELAVNKEFMVESESTTNLVIDFDLRKSIVADTTAGEPEYQFVSETELNSAVRVVDKNESGTVKGKLQGTFNANTEVYVYLYKKGSFNLLTETVATGSNKVLFANAVTSAKVQSDGSYVLPFVEEGSYEMHVAAYSKGMFGHTFNTMLKVQSTILGILLNSIQVQSSVATEINIKVS